MASSSSDLFGGGVADIFGGFGMRAKGNAAKIEAAQYHEAADFSRFNAKITEQSTGIQQMQQARTATQALGGVEAGVAAGGFNLSGSGIDLLRSSAQQAALEHAIVGQQGQITALGYEEQGKSYDAMAAAAEEAANASKLGEIGSFVTGAIKIGTAMLI